MVTKRSIQVSSGGSINIKDGISSSGETKFCRDINIDHGGIKVTSRRIDVKLCFQTLLLIHYFFSKTNGVGVKICEGLADGCCNEISIGKVMSKSKLYSSSPIQKVSNKGACDGGNVSTRLWFGFGVQIPENPIIVFFLFDKHTCYKSLIFKWHISLFFHFSRSFRNVFAKQVEKHRYSLIDLIYDTVSACFAKTYRNDREKMKENGYI